MVFVIHYLRAINNTKEKRQVCINTYIAIYFPVFLTEYIHWSTQYNLMNITDDG